MKTNNTRIWHGEHQTWIRWNARQVLSLDRNQYYETWFPTAKLDTIKERSGYGFTFVDRPNTQRFHP